MSENTCIVRVTIPKEDMIPLSGHLKEKLVPHKIVEGDTKDSSEVFFEFAVSDAEKAQAEIAKYHQEKSLNTRPHNDFLLSLGEVMYAVGGQLYEQSPRWSPRRVEEIMTEVRDRFINKSVYKHGMYTICIPTNSLYSFIKILMDGIEAFEELNLSEHEIEHGVKLGDKGRGKYAITSFDRVIKDEHNFVDLTAFVQNVTYRLKSNNVSNDCFGCMHKGSLLCAKCSVGKSCLYECERSPKGKYTISCDNDCYNALCICCSECDTVKDCEHRCNNSPNTCGKVYQENWDKNKMYKKEV